MKEVGLNIDGKEVKAKEGATIIEVAIQVGIRIPTLCYHESMSPAGMCRLCSVEVSKNGKAKVVPACTHHVEQGLVVNTATERVLRIRRGIIEVLLLRAPKAEVIQNLANEYGVKKTREKETERKCVSYGLCALCVRTCQEIVGVRALGASDEGKAGTPSLQKPEACIACGACAYVCPTGEVQVEDIGNVRIIRRWGEQEEYKLKECSLCGNCFAPEVQLEYFRRQANLPEGCFDVCPDCRE